MKEKVKELQIHAKDTGSSEVQIAQLTGKIESLSKQYLQILKSGKKPVLLSKKEMKKNIKKIKSYSYGRI